MSGIRHRIRGLFDLLFEEVDSSGPSAVSKADSANAEAHKAAHLALLHGLEACESGRLDAALDQFQLAFISFRLAEDGRSTALVQKTLALVISCIKDADTIRKAYKRAAMMLRQSGLRDEETRTLLRWADFEAGERRFQDAYAMFKSAVSLSRDHGDRLGHLEALGRYARVEADRGHVSEATAMIEEARELAATSKDPACIALAKSWDDRVLGGKSAAA